MHLCHVGLQCVLHPLQRLLVLLLRSLMDFLQPRLPLLMLLFLVELLVLHLEALWSCLSHLFYGAT